MNDRPEQPPGTLTRLLNHLPGPGSGAAHRTHDDLFAAVYAELRRLAQSQLARERRPSSLSTTLLVHEAYVRLVGGGGARWQNRAHFFGAAALAMRRLLVENARRRAVRQRVEGGSLDEGDRADPRPAPDPTGWIVLDEVLAELERFDPRMHDLVMLRVFTGLSVAHTAELLGCSERTVAREWAYARAWLSRCLREAGVEEGHGS